MIVLVLPAYDEGGAIGPLLDRVRATADASGLPMTSIVVNDGSTDGTPDEVRARLALQPLELIDRKQNLGLSATLDQGFRRALEVAGPDDVVATMDGDDTHPPGLIPRMFWSLREGRDVVVASRYEPGAQVLGLSWSRRVASGGAALLFRLLFPIQGIRDYTCGFRAMTAAALRAAYDRFGDRLFSEKGFSCTADLLLKLASLDLVMGEVPLILRYDRKATASKMRVGRTIGLTLRLLLRRRLGRWD